MSRNIIDKPYLVPLDGIISELDTNAACGLTKRAARERKSAQKRDMNKVKGAGERTPLFLSPRVPGWRCALQIFRDPFLCILLAVTVLAFIFGRTGPALAVAVLTSVNCTISGISYIKAQRIRESMQMYSNPLVRVIREGKLFTTESRNIVAGDIIVLSEGDIVPCDARLISSDGLTVVEFIPGENGEPEALLSVKNADRQYAAHEKVKPPFIENMVYGGSAVRSGNARAVAVAVGGVTYLGAMTGGISPSAGSADPKGLKLLKRYCVRYGIAMSFLILPVTFAGILISKLEIPDIFMMSLALVTASMSENMLAAGRVIFSAGIADIALCRGNNNAIIKNMSVDRLCETTDIFFCGRAGLTDGLYHINSVETCGKSYLPERCANANVFGLGKYLFMFSEGKKRSVGMGESDEYLGKFDGCIKSLVDFAGTDTEEYKLKTRATKLVRMTGINGEEVITSTDAGDIHTYMSRDAALIGLCSFIRTDSGIVALDDSIYNAVGVYNQVIARGCVALIYASGERGSMVLEAILSMRERTDRKTHELTQELALYGITSRFFLPDESEESFSYLCEAGICGEKKDAAYASEIYASGQTLDEIYENYTAFLGFGITDIASLAQLLKEKGRHVASSAVANRYNCVLAASETEISYDSIKYNSEKISDSVFENLPEDGKEESRRCSQITRRTADMLISRSGKDSGGLRGISGALYTVKSFYRNLSDMSAYLVSSQLMRLVLVILPLVSLMTPETAPELLFSGLLIDFCVVLVFAFAHPDKRVLYKQEKIPERLKNPIAGSVPSIIAGAVAAVAIWLCGFLPGLLYDGYSGANSYIFASLVLTQLACAFILLLTQQMNSSRTRAIGRMFGLTAVGAVICILMFTLIPVFGPVFGCDGINFIGVLLLPIGPCTYIAAYFLSAAAYQTKRNNQRV